MRDGVLSLIDWFIPDGLSGKYERRQARRAIIFALAIMFWAPVFAPIFLYLGSPAGSLIIVIAFVALFFSLVLLRMSRSVALTGNVIAFLTVATMVGLATRTGGPGSPSLPWLLAAPLVGLVICGVRSGVVWAVVACLTCFAFQWNDRWNVVTLANDIPAPELQILVSLATAGIILCVFSLTLAFKLGEEASREELELSRRESEAANLAKSQFLANMSHEIRTPMSAVLGLTDLVLESDLTAEQRDHLNTVMDSGESLLSIISEILDFSKIEAGKLKLELVPCDLRSGLRDIRKSLEPRAEGKGLGFRWEVEEDVPNHVVIDPVRLRQVLLNLVANAIKFTPAGEVSVMVRCDVLDDDRVDLQFEVHDTGIGIAAEKLEAIFCEFEQADASTTRKFGGTGLGLSISSRLVHLMGGHLQVESDEGQGTTFRFGIPAEKAHADVTHDRDEMRQTEDQRPVSMGTSIKDLNVLLAEDGTTNQRLAVLLLKRWGHRVSVADNGRIAIDLWKSGDFDLILMDIQMPELDGIGATEQIRALEKGSGSRIPIIALTAHALTGDRERSLAAGMDAYVTKPIRKAELAEAIEQVVDVSSREGASGDRA